MAQLVLGIGTSHSPQLSMSWDAWAMRGEGDKHSRVTVPPPGRAVPWGSLSGPDGERRRPMIVRENVARLYGLGLA